MTVEAAELLNDPPPLWTPYEWQDKAGAQRFEALTVSGLNNDVSSNSPVIANTIWSDSLQVLVGPANVGKSAVATAAALTIAQKLPFLGRQHVYPHIGFKPAILAGEAIGNVRNQALAWDIHHGDLLTDGDLITVPKTIDFSDHKIAAQLGNWLGEEEVGLVVIDPLVNYIGRGDENDSSHMAAVMRGIRIMAAELWCPNVVLVVHHANQAGGIRGSRVIRDLADVVYLVTADGPNTVKLKRDKNRFGVKDDTLYARLQHVADPSQNIDSIVATVSQNRLRQAVCLTVSQSRAWDSIRDNFETEPVLKADLARHLVDHVGAARQNAYRVIDALAEAGKLTACQIDGKPAYTKETDR